MKNPALHAIIAISTLFIASGRGKRRYLLNSSVKKKAIFTNLACEKKGDILENIQIFQLSPFFHVFQYLVLYVVLNFPARWLILI